MGRKDAIDLALAWLAHTDIRHADGAQVVRGGVNQGYHWQERSYPFVYSEITGYAISTFVNAYRWTGDDGYVTLARQSADFLLGIQALAEKDGVCGAIPHSLSIPDLELDRRYYSFDAAMCLQGLLDLDAVAPASELRESAQAIGDWLLERMQQDNGAFLSIYDAAAGEWGHAGENFFDDDGCLHAKHAIGLLKLGCVTGNDRYTMAARRVCDWVLGLQDDDGAFRANTRTRQIVSHPHCYATEGLLYAYHTLGTDRYLDACRRAGEWLLSAQNRDGSINIAYKQRWWGMGRRVTEKFFPRRVTDATAQAVRIWLILYYLDGARRFLDAGHKARGFLHELQCTSSSDRNAVGGIYFWPGHPMMFAWCTMFAVGALYALDHVSSDGDYQRMIIELF
jgi:uncharacterized protein YyaL (SSP411 family)